MPYILSWEARRPSPRARAAHAKPQPFVDLMPHPCCPGQRSLAARDIVSAASQPYPLRPQGTQAAFCFCSKLPVTRCGSTAPRWTVLTQPLPAPPSQQPQPRRAAARAHGPRRPARAAPAPATCPVRAAAVAPYGRTAGRVSYEAGAPASLDAWLAMRRARFLARDSDLEAGREGWGEDVKTGCNHNVQAKCMLHIAWLRAMRSQSAVPR